MLESDLMLVACLGSCSARFVLKVLQSFRTGLARETAQGHFLSFPSAQFWKNTLSHIKIGVVGLGPNHCHSVVVLPCAPFTTTRCGVLFRNCFISFDTARPNSLCMTGEVGIRATRVGRTALFFEGSCLSQCQRKKSKTRAAA